MFSYHVFEMLSDVFKYPVLVDMQVETKVDLEFPTVSICNTNKFKESSIRGYNPNSDLYKVISFENLNSLALRGIYDDMQAQLKSGLSDVEVSQ